MGKGWIKVYRKMPEWEWYTESKTFHLFMHLLFKARYFPSSWRGFKLRPGELITGRHQLSHETGISEQSIRTSLKRLESTGEIAIQRTNKFSVITVCNYCRYQGSVEDDNQQDSQLDSVQPKDDQPSTNHIQERKKGRRKEEKKNKGDKVASPKKADPVEDQANEVLAYLNEKTGKKLTSFGKIKERLRAGATVEQCKQVVDTKVADQNFDRKYLDHTTLFREANFDRYLNQGVAGLPGARVLTYEEGSQAHDEWADPNKNRWNTNRWCGGSEESHETDRKEVENDEN